MKLRHVTTTLEDKVEQLLQKQTPRTRDQDALNIQSQRQLSDATYRVNKLPGQVSDANHLVPQPVSTDNREKSWRYPPHMEASVLVHEDSLEDAELDIGGMVHRAGFLTYRETRPNYTGRITGSSDINTSGSFTTVDIGDSTVSLRTETENGEKYEDKSVPLQGYELSLESPIELGDLWANNEFDRRTATLQSESVPIRLYDPETDTTETATIDADGAVTDPVAVTPYTEDSDREAAYITLERGSMALALEVTLETSTTYMDYVRVRVRLHNTGTGSMPSQGYRLAEKSQSVFNPNLQLSFSGAELKFPNQQHADAIDDAVEGRDETSQQDREEIEATYTQVNGTLTQSVSDETTFLLTPYGVYDYHRELPVESYTIESLTESRTALQDRLDGLTDEERAAVADADGLLELARQVLSAVPDGFDLSVTNSLYAFQWEAIQRRLAILATDQQETTVLKAPTAAGKTLPFLVNAALTALYQDTRIVLAFPTRLLNEDMSQRVMRFTYALRKVIGREDISAGLLVGQSDPLYGSLRDIKEGEMLAQYDRCPACNTRGSVVATEQSDRIIGHCNDCGHDIDYVYHPGEAIAYLPTFTVATPDKLFYEATVRGYESQPYGKLPFFGGTYLPCDRCGAAASVMNPHPDWDDVTCPQCEKAIPLDPDNYEHSPIGHWVFDEVHSLHNLTGTLLSIFLELPDLLYSKIQGHDYHRDGYCHQPTFETGTATIANETELLSAITRTDERNIRPIPATGDYRDFFDVDEDSVRYRVLAMLPVATSNRQSVQRGIIATHDATHNDDDYRAALQHALDAAGRGADLSAYEFLLGYVYKKADGRALQTSIAEKSRERIDKALTPPFLSGDTGNEEMGELFEQAQEGDLSVLLANLVISLGVDIETLNQMIMLGAPKQMTEQAQTAGRTGRGDAPGHVTIHLLPSNPRDAYLYTNFHRVMGDIEGYYETYPIQPTNAHAAELLVPNLLKAVLAGLSYEEFALTANTAAQALSDSRRNEEIQADLLRLLRTSDTDKALVAEIHDVITAALGEYAHEWGRLDESPYLSSWFQGQDELMYTLRKSSDKSATVDIEEDGVLHEINTDYTVTN